MLGVITVVHFLQAFGYFQFPPFPPLPPCTHFWWWFLYKTPFWPVWPLIPLPLLTHPFFFVWFGFLYFLPYPVFHTFSHFSSLLFCYANFFYPTCFLFQLFPVHLAIRVGHCMLSLPICPVWRKAWLFDTLGCNFFSPLFPRFPHWMLSYYSLLFTYLHCFWDSIASFLIHLLVPPAKQLE